MRTQPSAPRTWKNAERNTCRTSEVRAEAGLYEDHLWASTEVSSRAPALTASDYARVVVVTAMDESAQLGT